MIRSFARRLYRLVLPLLYSRARFKLFLNAAFGDINLRMLSLASATDYFAAFVRPIPIRAPFGKSMLIVAPHQDDEAIGCGGALALQVRSGNAASIVLLQDGADGYDELGFATRQSLTDLRNEESRQAAAVIGLPAPHFLNHARLAEAAYEASQQLRRIVEEQRADAIFIPFPLDAHPDHRIANYILAESLRGVTHDARIFGYEVWGLCVPNVLVIIDSVVEEKKRMLSCFRFANAAIDYAHSTIGLNMYHSRMLGSGDCRYAERFFELPRQEYIELVERIKAQAVRAAETA